MPSRRTVQRLDQCFYLPRRAADGTNDRSSFAPRSESQQPAIGRQLGDGLCVRGATISSSGAVAQLGERLRWQREGQGFDPPRLHPKPAREAGFAVLAARHALRRIEAIPHPRLRDETSAAATDRARACAGSGPCRRAGSSSRSSTAAPRPRCSSCRCVISLPGLRTRISTISHSVGVRRTSPAAFGDPLGRKVDGEVRA